MVKNNRKKTVAQAISTAVVLGWVIMQVESAQAATLTVNNLNDDGVGSLRDTINIATSSDVVEFFLGSYPSTINLTSGAIALAKNLTINGPGANLLTISSNNQFPVFDISAANVAFSGLAIAGNINAYDSRNLTFTNSTVSSDNVKIDNATGDLRLINSTISSKNNIEINASRVSLYDHSNLVGGNITITADSIFLNHASQLTVPISTVNGNSGQISSGSNNSGAGGNITITADRINVINPGSQVTIPISTVNDNSGQINGGSNNSGAGGTISIKTDFSLLKNATFISKAVPEPSAIAGSILAGSLAWLAKRKQAAFRKAKV